MVNRDRGKVAKLSHEHKSTYPSHKHLKHTEGSDYKKQQDYDIPPVMLED
ncbi:hypothetical protein [Cytobacillus gottheilii]|uniref:Uncharacterized protein n=1 Tax=Cytobacillus gottheilii TaxID=859144 RepID=A0ABX8FDN9_9BACI|nr:hypothetical protein [Cytobacillus gottheilii]QVY61837.1 hypothetical protein J1899_01495 [Cytobacillus gottheilii]